MTDDSEQVDDAEVWDSTENEALRMKEEITEFVPRVAELLIRSAVALEMEHGRARNNAKLFRISRKRLGELQAENARPKALLERHGIDPEQD